MKEHKETKLENLTDTDIKYTYGNLIENSIRNSIQKEMNRSKEGSTDFGPILLSSENVGDNSVSLKEELEKALLEASKAVEIEKELMIQHGMLDFTNKLIDPSKIVQPFVDEIAKVVRNLVKDAMEYVKKNKTIENVISSTKEKFKKELTHIKNTVMEKTKELAIKGKDETNKFIKDTKIPEIIRAKMQNIINNTKEYMAGLVPNSVKNTIKKGAKIIGIVTFIGAMFAIIGTAWVIFSMVQKNTGVALGLITCIVLLIIFASCACVSFIGCCISKSTNVPSTPSDVSERQEENNESGNISKKLLNKDSNNDEVGNVVSSAVSNANSTNLSKESVLTEAFSIE